MSIFLLWLAIKFPVIIWQMLLLIGMGLLVVGYFFVRSKGRFWCMGGGCLLVVIAAFFLSCYAYVQACCWVQARSDMLMHVGPADWHHVIGTIKKGELLCVNLRCGAWKCFQSKMCNGWIFLP